MTVKYPKERYVEEPPLHHSDLLVRQHLDGVPWHDAEPPPWNHECWAQSKYNHAGKLVHRCACGAIREARYCYFDDERDVWQWVNETRTSRGERPPTPLSWLRRIFRRSS
jgi:hypothetical protein